MGYFANGSEGDAYDARYCRRCQHRPACPVWGLHLLYNYDQCRDTETGKELAIVLGYLIPRDGVRNKECRMFTPHPRGPLMAYNPEWRERVALMAERSA